jgi:hypothetical protein
MSTWTEQELRAVAAATDLRSSTRRIDGTLRPPVPIWVVRAGDDLYVRHREPHGTAARAEIDQAYSAKYTRHATPTWTR